MTTTTGPARALGGLLREFRRGCDVEATGFPRGTRRTPGLRREELAALAGVSVDYLVQLEQGRAARPSAPVVAALARALRLAEDDTALLHRAAGLAAPTGAVRREVPAAAERLVERLGPLPAAVYSADWWVLRWNAAWAALLGDPLGKRGRERNVVWYEMVEPNPRVWVDPAEDEVFRDAVVGDLRVALLEHPDDAELVDLVQALTERSAEFVERWTSARPARYRGMRKRVDHAEVGPMTLDGDVLEVPGGDVRVLLYSATPGSVDAERLALLTADGGGGVAVTGGAASSARTMRA